MSDSTQSPRSALPLVALQLATEHDTEAAHDALAFVQQSFYFAHQFFPEAPVCNAATAIRMLGPLSVSALERAYRELFERHEQLRTTFHEQDGAIVPRVHAAADARLERVDLSLLPDARRGPELERVLDAAACARFDLAQPPLLRATLIRVADGEHVLALVTHHIVADGASFLGILHRELGQLYGAYLRGGASPLPPVRGRYADFVAMQAERNRGAHLARRLEYFRRHLEGAPRSIDLPADRARPAMPSGRGERLHFPPLADLREPLRLLAAQLRVPLHDVLLSAFFALLYRYAGQADMVLGMPFANRTRRLEQVYGCMINTLPLRARVDPEQPFGTFVEQVRTQVFRSLANADLAFEKLVEHLGRDAHDSSRSQIHQVVFNYMPFSTAATSFDGLSVTVRRLDCRATFLDLVLEVEDAPEGLAIALLYSTDLYEAASMRRFAHHYEQLLRSVLRDPGVAVGRLEFMTSAEIEQIERWNSTELSISDPALVHELFERWAERTPDAPAIELARGPQSYRELNRDANRLARALLAPTADMADRFVGIYLDRGPDVLLPILAILKAGCAYVPVDAETPAARANAIFVRAGVRAVLTTRALAPALQLPSAAILCIDDELHRKGQAHGGNLGVGVREQDAAYVLFTSGSTGEPKGVVVEHRQIRNYLATILPQLQAEPGASFAMVTTFAADLGLAMLFGAPCTGGHLHILDGALAVDPGRLADYFAMHRIDYVKIVPTHMEALLQSAQRSALLPRRALILAGDRLTPDLVRMIREAGARCRIYNHYGPTETCISMLTHEVAEADHYRHRVTIPIGKPIGNVQCHVLDERLQRLPVGVPGELYIGGACVSRGYLQRPDLTAERFVPDPFTGDGRARMYRTGDRVRYDAEGHIEFIARIDGQVKIRGYRVELGEIEAALRELGTVEQVAVLAHDDARGERQLVAYCVAAKGQSVRPDELRRQLGATLPKYMVPAHFVELPVLPTTPNGKLDRRALPAPESAQLLPAPRFERPSELRRQPKSRWFYAGGFHPRALPAPHSDGPHRWLLLMDELGLGEHLARELVRRGDRVVCVRSRDTFRRAGSAEYHLNPEHGRDGFLQLARELEAGGFLPDRIAHLWLLTPAAQPVHRAGSSPHHHALAHGYEAVLHLVQTLNDRLRDRLHLWLISNRMHSVAGESCEPDKAAVLGACAALSRELPRLGATCVDIEWAAQPGSALPAPAFVQRRRRSRAGRALLREFAAPSEGVVAYRGGVRYERRYAPLSPPLGLGPVWPRARGATGPVLITGALDPIGAAFVRQLCAQPGARLLLLLHSERASAFETAAVRARVLAQLPELRGLAAERWQALDVDLTDPSAVGAALQWGTAMLGKVRAVVHAAGSEPRPMPLPGLDPEEAIDAMAVAMQGLRVLGELLDVGELEAMLLCSSADLAVRAPGMSATAAVSAFFEAYAANSRPRAPVHAVAFGPFQRPSPATGGASSVAAQIEQALLAHGIGRADEAECVAKLFALSADGPASSLVDPIALDMHDELCAAAAAAAAGAGKRAARPPRDDIERKLLCYWRDTLGATDLHIDDDFFERGGHSLAAVKLFARIQHGFGVQFPLAELFTAPTIAQSAARIREALAGTAAPASHRFLVPIAPGPGTRATPLFVVHGALGNVLNLKHLGRLVGQDRPVFALQAKGLLGDDAPHARFEEAASDYLREVRAQQPQGPYLLSGFCIGGNIAYEMAQQLVAAGEEVALLVMLDSYAPDGDFDPPTRWDNLQLHALRLRRLGLGYVRAWAETRLRWEAQRLRARFTRPIASEPLDSTTFRSSAIHEAMRKARRAYRVRPYAGKVVVFRPRQGDEAHVGRFARYDWRTNLWSPHARALEVHEVPGDHDGCVLEPALRTLVARLRPLLHEADATARSSAPTDRGDE